MYRSRVNIWLIGIVTVLILMGGNKLILWMTEEPIKYNVYCDSEDNIFRDNITGKKGDYFLQLKDSINDVDIIINNSSDKYYDGYVKYENKIYSPIVLFARRECLEEESGFSINDKRDNEIAYKDLKTILIAMEKNKTFEQIGISKNVAREKVKLFIPDKNSVYYSLIEELFYLTLNNNIQPDEETIEKLKPRVTELLKKCGKVEDIGQKMKSDYNNDKNNYSLFLGPEHIISRDIYAFCSSNNYTWVPVYLNNTNTYSYDLFVKEENKKEILKSLNSDFSEDTGFRIYNSDFKFDSIFDNTSNNIKK